MTTDLTNRRATSSALPSQPQCTAGGGFIVLDSDQQWTRSGVISTMHHLWNKPALICALAIAGIWSGGKQILPSKESPRQQLIIQLSAAEVHTCNMCLLFISAYYRKGYIRGKQLPLWSCLLKSQGFPLE